MRRFGWCICRRRSRAASRSCGAGFPEDSLSSEVFLLVAALVAVYIVLGVLYESFIHPITILSTLPSAGIGALLALMIDGKDLDVIGIIGIVLLIGIVKKNAIMIVDFALEAEREHGKSPEEAIFEASLLRFRPILMTTLAAMFGALPMLLGSGTGSELRRPLGLAIIGGLALSQVLTLFTSPVIYLAFDRLAKRFGRRRPGPAGRARREHLRPLRRSAGGDDAAGHRDLPVGHARLFQPARGALAQHHVPRGGGPGDPGRGCARNHGGHGRRAAGEAHGHDRRRNPVDLDELCRRGAHHRPI